MFSYIKMFLSNMFGKNTAIYQKPLNTISVILVVAFDLFLFYNILSGYNHQRDLVVSPYEKFSCIDYFNYDKHSLLDRIAHYYPDDEYVKIDLKGNKKVVDHNSDACKFIYKKILDIQNSDEYKKYKSQLDYYKDHLSNLEAKKQDYERQYRDFLEELKAGVSDENSRLSDINKENARRDYTSTKEQIMVTSQKKEALINDFLLNNSDFNELVSYLEKNKESFLKNYDKEVFWYPVKITGLQSLLVLPLFLTSLFFYKLFLRKQNKIFTVLFSNLTFISGIFVFVLFLKVVYFILPKKLLASFIELLRSLSLGFLWNYILAIIGVGVFGFVIYLSQKGSDKIRKIKEEQERLRIERNKKKVQMERFWSGLCVECNSKLLSGSRYCQVCGEDQYYECKNCKNLVPKVFDFCNKCGINNKE